MLDAVEDLNNITMVIFADMRCELIEIHNKELVSSSLSSDFESNGLVKVLTAFSTSVIP